MKKKILLAALICGLSFVLSSCSGFFGGAGGSSGTKYYCEFGTITPATYEAAYRMGQTATIESTRAYLKLNTISDFNKGYDTYYNIKKLLNDNNFDKTEQFMTGLENGYPFIVFFTRKADKNYLWFYASK